MFAVSLTSFIINTNPISAYLKFKRQRNNSIIFYSGDILMILEGALNQNVTAETPI